MSQNVPFPFDLAGAPSGPVPSYQTSSGPQPSQQRVPPPLNGQFPTSTNLPTTAPQQNGQQPGNDLAALPALQGISLEQLTLIARLLQSGGLTIPSAPGAPPIPVAAATVAPVAPSNAGLSIQEPNLLTQAPQDDVDMDKEEGELEEGEEPDTIMEREFLRPPPTGPRKRSASPRVATRQPPKVRNFTEPKARTKQEDRHSNMLAGEAAAGPGSATSSAKQKLSRKDATSAFVKTMYKAGYTFDQLAQGCKDSQTLRHIFKQLDLPVEAAAASSSMDEPAAVPRLVTNGTSIPLPHIQKAEAQQVSALKRAMPAKPNAPVDRNDYLARLKALQSKKPEQRNASPVPTSVNATPPSGPVTEQKKTNAPSTASAPARATQAPKPIEKNELLRKKLEALKAIQAAKAKAAQPSGNESATVKPTASPLPLPVPQMTAPLAITPKDVFKAGSGNASTDVQQPIQSTPIPAVPLTAQSTHVTQPSTWSVPPMAPPLSGQGFSLPGLFMFNTPTQPVSPQNGLDQGHAPAVRPPTSNIMSVGMETRIASPAASPAPLLVSRKRPVASDFDRDLPTEAAPDTKRPLFGQSRSNSESERLVIEVSEDEDDDMDLDKPTDQPKLQTPAQTKALAGMGPLRDFPPVLTFSAPSMSPGIPTVTTPGSAAQYAKKMADIEAIKRQIAAKEAAKLNFRNSKPLMDSSAPTSGTNTPVANAAGTPAPAANSKEPPQVLAQDTTASAAANAAAQARRQEKEIWRRRILELEQERLRHSSAGLRTSDALPRTAPSMAEDVPTEGLSPAQAAESTAPEDVSEAGQVDDVGNQIIAAARAAEGDRGKFGSQATTASSASQIAMLPQMEPDTVQDPSLASQHVEANEPPAVVAPNSAAAEDSMQSSMDASAEDGEIDEDESKDDDSEMDMDIDDSSDEHDDGAQPVPPAAARLDHQDVTDHRTDPTLLDTSSASSDDEDESSQASDASPGEPNDDLHEAVTSAPTNMSGVQAHVTAKAGDEPMPTVSAVPRMTRAEALVDENIAPELRVPASEEAAIDNQETMVKTFYTPYQSPLARFKDYRYHADFLHNVPGGFKSLTYSNNIDPYKPICQTEVEGGTCTDSKCIDQHFGTMALSDNDLLRLLGTHNSPVTNPAEEKQWREGLSAVVKQLRITNLGKDAGIIAARIAEFRREFLGDPTRVIHLKPSY